MFLPQKARGFLAVPKADPAIAGIAEALHLPVKLPKNRLGILFTFGVYSVLIIHVIPVAAGFHSEPTVTGLAVPLP